MNFSCYYCDFQTDSQTEYQSHGVANHRGKPCYAGQADIELYGLKAQGKWWEKPVNNKEAILRYVERKEKQMKKEAFIDSYEYEYFKDVKE